jgi:hypothetical protein
MKIFHLGFGHFLEEDEMILRVFRRPFLFSLARMVSYALLWGSVAAVLWFFYPFYHQLDLTWLWGSFFLLALYKVSGAFFFWYFNGILMTNESLIFVDWPRLFHRNFTRIDFHNLDEIEVERHGVSSFFWNYGRLRFQKINGGERIEIPKINAPKRVARIIEKYREQRWHEKNYTEDSVLKHLLSGMVHRHVDAHGIPSDSESFSQASPTPNRALLDKAIKTPKLRSSAEKNEKSTGFWSGFLQKEKTTKTPVSPRESKEDREILVEKELDDEGGVGIDLRER